MVKKWCPLIILLLSSLFLVFLLAGCQQPVKYVCSDGSVVSDASLCPIEEEETEIPITTPEITPTDTFVMKISESVDFEGKTIKLLDVSNDGKTLVDVSGVTREIMSTKQVEIVNGLEVVVLSINYVNTDPDSSMATLKFSPLTLGYDEYLFYVDKPQSIEGIEVTLTGVASSYILIDTDDVSGMKIYPGSSKIVSGLNITNFKAFPRGVRAEDYAILIITKA
ncbi:MAG: hypothetical protein ABIH63_03425 [archaeon]